MKLLNRDQENRIQNLIHANRGASTILRRVLGQAPEEFHKDLANAILVIDMTTASLVRAMNE